MRDGDVIAGGLTAALGVYITMTAMSWEIMGPDGPGPGFFPVGYGVALVALSLVLIFQRVLAQPYKMKLPSTGRDCAARRRPGSPSQAPPP